MKGPTVAKTPEQEDREIIDNMLGSAGWAVQDVNNANILAKRGVALREFSLNPGHGFAGLLNQKREERSMGRKEFHDKDLVDLDELIEEITVDAYGDDEKLWAFLQVFEDEISLPADGFVIGEPVSVVKIDYDGNERRGLTARCRREDGSEHVVAASDVVFPEGSNGALYHAAYRKWLGLEPYPAKVLAPARHSRGAGRRKAHGRIAQDRRRHHCTFQDPGGDTQKEGGRTACAGEAQPRGEVPEGKALMTKWMTQFLG
jgi:hypothetical protein